MGGNVLNRHIRVTDLAKTWGGKPFDVVPWPQELTGRTASGREGSRRVKVRIRP